MSITISATDPRVQYTASGGQTAFSVPFEFFADADLNVYVDGTKKTLTTHYSVTGGDGTTGSISMSVTGGTGGSTVIITRGISLERTTDFPVSGAFAVGTLNTELDRFVAIQADLNDTITRSIRLADDDAAVSMELPDKADRLGKVLSFHSSTGAVQVQTYASPDAVAAIDGVTAGTVAASKFLQVDANRDLATIRNLTSDGTITASSFVIGSAAINENDLEALDDVTAGTVAASKAAIVDTNKDITGFRNITLTGELDAATLDISGNADIDGTLEAATITVNGTALATYIRDTVGTNMLSSNDESGITVTYDTTNDNIDFAVDAAQTGITSLLATDIKIGEDDQTKIDFETADEIHFYAANVEQVYLGDNIFGPQADSDVDLGSTGVRWKDAFVDSITVTGEVDGASLDISGDANIAGEVQTTKIAFTDGDDSMTIGNGGVVTFHNGFNIGSDASGDILYNSGTGYVRLAKGSDGQTLTLASGLPSWASASGDIAGVTAGVGLSGGGTSGTVSLALDLSELSDVTPVNGDKLATLDSDGSTEQLTTIASLATLFAGTGLTASSSVIGVDAAQTGITSVFNTSLEVGRDADNNLNFSTDNQIDFDIAANAGRYKMFLSTFRGGSDNAIALGSSTYRWSEVSSMDLSLYNEDNDASSGPVLAMYRKRGSGSSPAGQDDDILGEIKFHGRDSGGNATNFSLIQSQIGTASGGSETGNILFTNMNGGSSVVGAKLEGTNFTVTGDLTISGDDLFMATNTSGHMLVADGTNYNPVAISGDVTMASNGAITIADDAVGADQLAANAVVNASVASGAAIADTKLAAISTANKVALTALDIDGGTDIGAAIVDADLFIIDDGGGGTNKKVAASRIKTYISASTSPTAADDIGAGDAAVSIATSTGNITLDAQGNNTDIIFKGTTSTSDTTFLTLDGGNGGAASFNGVVTANAGVVVDNITIDGTEIDLSSGDLTVDVAGDIVLDANGGDVFLKDDGATFGSLTNTSGNLIIKSGTTTAATFSGANVTLAGTVGSGAITSTGNITAYSDKRLKSGIQTLENGLSKIEQLRGVTYTRNDNVEGGQQLGVIAQEVEEVFPQIVKTADDEMGTKSVDYGRLTGALIEAVKELSEKVKTLEKIMDT